MIVLLRFLIRIAMANQELSYDTKALITVLLLLLVYPIGLVIMWRWMKWSKLIMHVISLPIYLFALMVVLGVVLFIIGALTTGVRF